VTLLYPEFDDCGTSDGAGVPTALRIGVIPVGAVNGINTVFTTIDNFIHDGVSDERVYVRGQRLLEGAGNDYTASESGGVGAGFDTITLVKAPRPSDNILVDYYID